MIDSFSGKNHFLSNFSEAEVWLDGESYPSTEHAYQAAKTLDKEQRDDIRRASTPNDAKRMGRKATLRPDWEEIKYETMHSLVRQKFRQHAELSRKLLQTGDQELIEGNWWGDTYWGVCRGKGENNLGRVLMDVRKELQERIDG